MLVKKPALQWSTMLIRRLSLLLLPVSTALLLLVMLAYLNGQANSSLFVAPLRHLALIGSRTEIITVTTPFINSDRLKLLREYPNPMAFLREAPVDYLGGNIPPDLAVMLFEITSPAEAAFIRQEVINATVGYSVVVNSDTDDLLWLSFMPGQLVVSGPCLNILEVVDPVPGLGNPVILDFDDQGICAENEQIRLYSIISGEKVLSKTAQLNELHPAVVAEPNYLTVGTPDEGSISGSPGGPFTPDAPPAIPLPQPFDGRDVRVVVFDTVPFTITPGGSYSQTFQGVVLTALSPFTLPLDLPTSDRYVPAHGTFVAGGAMGLAPQAEFQLVRVLNDWAVGDSFSLYRAIRTAVTDIEASHNVLHGAVFNYSLVQEAPISTTMPITAMESILSWVEEQGIAQVASAGNDSAYTSNPQPMPYPARHPAVVGATAVTWDNTITCYANIGEVAVWGGGIPRDPETLCHTETITATCNPQTCVAGWDPNSLSTNYAYGFGTSFTAPLVTGFTAQAIQVLSPAPGSWPALSCVRQNIYNFAAQMPYADSAVIEHGILSNPYHPGFTPFLFGPCPHTLFLPVITKPPLTD